MPSATESRDAVSFRRAGARSVVPRWRSLAEILRPNGVLHTIRSSQNVQCQNRKHQAQTGCRNDGSHHNEPTASWRPPRTARGLATAHNCTQSVCVDGRWKPTSSISGSALLGNSARSAIFHVQCVFRHQPANDMTGVTAAGHRNSFAPDCIRHWQATKRHP